MSYRNMEQNKLEYLQYTYMNVEDDKMSWSTPTHEQSNSKYKQHTAYNRRD